MADPKIRARIAALFLGNLTDRHYSELSANKLKGANIIEQSSYCADLRTNQFSLPSVKYIDMLSSQVQDSYRVLIVDDEEDILAITKKSLERYGHIADTFSNAVNALEHFKNNPKLYDVVISDVRMPGIRGYELLTEMKRLNPSIKVFLMSAYEVWQSTESLDPAAKVDDFLQKPFDRHVLCMTLRKHMSRTG